MVGGVCNQKPISASQLFLIYVFILLLLRDCSLLDKKIAALASKKGFNIVITHVFLIPANLFYTILTFTCRHRDDEYLKYFIHMAPQVRSHPQ